MTEQDISNINTNANTNQTKGTAPSKKRKERKAPLMDPLLMQSIGLNTDIYAVTWTALRNDVWQDITFRGEPVTLTPDNYTWLKIRFLTFISIMVVTVTILFFEMFASDVYKPATYTITILRITLITWAQHKLGPEFTQGISMLRYSVKNNDLFHSPGFAVFVSLCQISIATITLFSIIVFVCMADSALELVMNFAGLSILSELDDWIGEFIMSNSLNDNGDKQKNQEFDMTNINERMRLSSKLAFLEESFEIVDDQNWEFSNSFFIQIFSYLIFAIPWVFLPLITLPIDYALESYHNRV